MALFPDQFPFFKFKTSFIHPHCIKEIPMKEKIIKRVRFQWNIKTVIEFNICVRKSAKSYFKKELCKSWQNYTF